MYKLVLDNFEKEFTLIGISTSLEAFRLAFLINKKLNINLKRTQYDVKMSKKDNVFNFELFKYEDIRSQYTYYLAQNKSILKEKTHTENALFNIEQSLVNHLIPSHKQVQYFLKIEDEDNRINQKKIIFALNEIPQLISVFHLQKNEVKSSENLIFE